MNGQIPPSPPCFERKTAPLAARQLNTKGLGKPMLPMDVDCALARFCSWLLYDGMMDGYDAGYPSWAQVEC